MEEAAFNPSASLTGRVWRRLRRHYRKRFQDRNYIYVHEPSAQLVASSPFEILRYERADDIPLSWQEAIMRRDEQSFEVDRLEMAKTAVMLVAILDQQPVGVLLSRYGRCFKHWYVELQDCDIVLSRARVFPEFRGRGIGPALLGHATSLSLAEGCRAYTDCRVYNKPSIRMMQKAGFVRIATMKALSRDEVLR